MTTTAPPPALRYRHASGLHAVARSLDALHRDLLRDEGADGTVIRTSVVNIVAACTEESLAAEAGDDLLRIGTRHPTRAIVILAHPEGDQLLEAEVSLHCAADNRQVCTELVRLKVSGDPAYHLTSIVTPLLIPDMPVFLWIAGSPPLRQAFSEEAVALTERIVIDSAAYDDCGATLTLLADQLQHYGEDLLLSDISWERTRAWRQALAQAFDPVLARALLRHITTITVTAEGGRTSSETMLLLGWLASRLGWDASSTPRLEINATGDGADGQATSVHIAASAGDRDGEVSVTRAGDVLRTHTHIRRVLDTRSAVTVPVRDRADLIADMLSGSADDHVYRDSVRHAARIAGMQ